MRKFLLSALLLISSIAVCSALTREGLSEYKLDNGLTVLLWEDHDQPDVSGYIVVRAGAVDEPAEYTGLAHYLEHMMFKGTQKIGALDWEKEKPIYDSIIALYGAPKRDLMDKPNSAELERLMEQRKNYLYKSGDTPIFAADGADKYPLGAASPILSQGDLMGCVMLLLGENDSPLQESDQGLTKLAAGFLGRQMES
jgi:hypothetical protein